MLIECKRYKEIKKGTFIGYADLTLSEIGIEVFGCTLHQKDEKRWVNLPSRTYKDLTGTDKHAPIIRFSDPSKFREFCICAKESVDNYIKQEAYNVKN
jgi:hypothetical protein